MKKIIIALIYIFFFAYFLQAIIYPIVIFRTADKEFGDVMRFLLPGGALAPLGYFWGLNRYLTTKKISGLILAFLGITFIFFMGFRTMITGIILMTFVIFVRIHGFNLKMVFYSLGTALIFFAIIQIPYFTRVVETMLAKQETQNLNNKDYVRVISFYHYTHEHFKNIVEYILGSGLPSNDSAYGSYIHKNLLSLRGIYYADWGLLGLSWMIGIVPVISMILYSIKAIRINIGSEYYFIGIWFIYLVLISITTKEFYREGNFIVQALGLYFIEKKQQEQNSLRRLHQTNHSNENRNINIS
jgi:hypothetical protein